MGAFLGAEAIRPPCGYCGSDLSAVSHGFYVRCPICRSLNRRPLPMVEDNSYFEGAEAVERMDADDLARRGFLEARLLGLEAILGTPKPGDMLLEIGCSTGRLMEIAQNRGWGVAGLEMSEELAARAREVTGAVVETGDILTAGNPLHSVYTAVIALDVIEHVVDPQAFLNTIARMLRPGGALLIHTPNAASIRARLHKEKWNMCIPQYHLHLATPKGITMAAERCGFEVAMMCTTSGTGREKSAGALLRTIKESVLGMMKLGNGLEAVLVRKRTS